MVPSSSTIAAEKTVELAPAALAQDEELKQRSEASQHENSNTFVVVGCGYGPAHGQYARNAEMGSRDFSNELGLKAVYFKIPSTMNSNVCGEDPPKESLDVHAKSECDAASVDIKGSASHAQAAVKQPSRKPMVTESKGCEETFG